MEGSKRKYPISIQKEAAESSENKYKKHNVNTLLERQRSHLSSHRADLVQRIPTMDVVDRLIELHGAPEEQIQCELDNKGSVRANRQLLKVVMGLHDGYVKLVKALDKIPGMSDLVEKLSKDDKGLSLMEEVEHTRPIHRFDKQVALQMRTYDHSLPVVVKPLREYIDGEVRNKLLLDLSRSITKLWRILGRELSLDDSDLDQLERDYTNQGHQETVYQMLLTWKQRNGSEATYRVLGEALKAAGRRDLQEKLYVQASYPVCPLLLEERL